MPPSHPPSVGAYKYIIGSAAICSSTEPIISIGSSRCTPSQPVGACKRRLRPRSLYGKMAGRLTPAPTAGPGLTPCPHLHRDRLGSPHAHICTGTDWAHPMPHLHRDRAHPMPASAPGLGPPLRICAGTGLAGERRRAEQRCSRGSSRRRRARTARSSQQVRARGAMHAPRSHAHARTLAREIVRAHTN